MTADQRRLFEETLAEDEADLQARIDALRNAKTPAPPAGQERAKRQPRRAAASRTPAPRRASPRAGGHAPARRPSCGRPMVRIGEDVSERLDIVPAEFFVAPPHPRQVGMQVLPDADPGAGRPAADRQGHARTRAWSRTCWSAASSTTFRTTGKRRSTPARACTRRARRWPPGPAPPAPSSSRSAKRTRRSSWVPRCCTPTRRRCPCSTPARARRRRPTSGATLAASSTGLRGVVYDFCVGRGAKYPAAFLGGWNGTLVCDDYKGYEPVFKLGKRIEAGCLVHARRKFEELIKNGHASPVAEEAIRRMGWIFWIEKQARAASPADRLAIRHDQTRGRTGTSCTNGCARSVPWCRTAAASRRRSTTP